MKMAGRDGSRWSVNTGPYRDWAARMTRSMPKLVRPRKRSGVNNNSSGGGPGGSGGGGGFSVTIAAERREERKRMAARQMTKVRE
jgi:hypothetical protein